MHFRWRFTTNGDRRTISSARSSHSSSSNVFKRQTTSGQNPRPEMTSQQPTEMASNRMELKPVPQNCQAMKNWYVSGKYSLTKLIPCVPEIVVSSLASSVHSGHKPFLPLPQQPQNVDFFKSGQYWPGKSNLLWRVTIFGIHGITRVLNHVQYSYWTPTDLFQYVEVPMLNPKSHVITGRILSSLCLLSYEEPYGIMRLSRK